MKYIDYSGRQYRHSPRIDHDFLAMRKAYEEGEYEPLFPELFEDGTVLGEASAQREVLQRRSSRILKAFRELGIRYSKKLDTTSYKIEALMNHRDGLQSPHNPQVLADFVIQTYALYQEVSERVHTAEGWKLYPAIHRPEVLTDPTPTPPTDGGEPAKVPVIMDSLVHESAYLSSEAA